MKLLIVFGAIFLITQRYAEQKEIVAILGVLDRVAVLKHQIAQKINKKQTEKIMPIDNEDLSANYEYMDRQNEPITPIMDFDERKQNEKYKLRELKTTTDKEQLNVRIIKDGGKNENDTTRKSKSLRSKNKAHKSKTPVDIFYRRIFLEDINFVKEWTHCQDLITPFFRGHKVNMTQAKRITYDNYLVLRLVQLIGEDTTDHTKDDIYSILYQISNLQIRLFQWDIAAIKLLLNTINKEYAKTHKMHTFRSIKEGVGRLLSSWNLDFTNTTNLLSQARIFRPPCVKVTDYGGSTKTSRVSRYTKSVKPKCQDDNSSDDECKYY